MTKLVSLAGADTALNPTLLDINPQELSDFDAGAVFFKIVSEVYPGITWGELWDLSPQKLSGWWTDLKKGAGDIYDGVKGVVGDWKDGIGDIGGDTIRLLADEDVSQTVMDAVAVSQGKAPSGGSKGSESNDLLTVIGAMFSKAGENYKKAEIPPAVIYGGAALVGTVVLLAVLHK